jgi:hypothetical protein
MIDLLDLCIEELLALDLIPGGGIEPLLEWIIAMLSLPSFICL